MSKPKIMDTVVKLAGAVDPSLEKSINKTTKALGGIDLKAAAIGATVAAGAVIAIKALADMGKGLYELGKEFDNAYDAIRVGTGATGEQLESLKDDFKNVYTSVPTSMEDASKAIADYNTKLGVSGDVLSNLSSQAIAVSGMLGEDLGSTIDSSSKAFQQWNISADDMGGKMDYIFKVSQSTGMGFNALMGNLQTFGPQLQQLGFSFEQSAAMMGQMEKAGMNTEEVMGALKKSVGVFAKEGLNAADGMQKYYEKIKNAKDETEAITIANEIFGKRAGSTMAAGIRNGTLEVDAFTKALNDSDESIMKAMWDTADAQEKWQLLTQQFQALIEPLGSAVFDNVAELMPTISQAMQGLVPVIQNVVQLMVPLVNEVFKYVADFIEQAGPLVAELAGAILPLLVNILGALLPIILELTKGILPILTSIVTALAPILNVLCAVISQSLSQALEIVMPLLQNFIGILTNIIDFVVNVFTLQWGSAWQNIVNIFGNTFGLISGLVKAPLNAIIGSINAVIAGINAMNIQIPEWVPGLGGKGFHIAIPPFPMLAAGGFTDGVSIAGEKGTEAVISFNSAYRDRNLSIWEKAGEMLGVSDGSSVTIDIGGVTFAPVLQMKENADTRDIMQKLEEHESEFTDLLINALKRHNAKAFG